MEIIKPHNKIARQIENWDQIKAEAKALIKFLDENQGKFKGEHQSAFAISHAQVSEDPWNFFVVCERLIKDKVFKSRVIMNAKILKAEKPARLDEGCMSFPYRKAKKVERFLEVMVEYQIRHPFPTILDRFKTIQETCIWPKSQVFQHEIEHAQGKNIYFQ